jgi:hypothetical protein
LSAKLVPTFAAWQIPYGRNLGFLDGNGRTQFFYVLQYTSDIIIPCCLDSIISTPFLFQNQLQSAFWQADIYLNIFGLPGECIYTTLTTFWFQHCQMKARFYHVIEIFIVSFVVLLREVRAETILCILCTSLSIFRTHVAQNL